MQTYLSKEVETILCYARDEAMRVGSYSIGADHLMLAILRHSANHAVDALCGMGVDCEGLKKSIDSMVFHEHCIPYCDADNVNLSRSAQNTISMAVGEAIKYGQGEVKPEHLLLAMCLAEGSFAKEALHQSGIRHATLTERLKRLGHLSPDRAKTAKEEDEMRISELTAALSITKKTQS